MTNDLFAFIVALICTIFAVVMCVYVRAILEELRRPRQFVVRIQNDDDDWDDEDDDEAVDDNYWPDDDEWNRLFGNQQGRQHDAV